MIIWSFLQLNNDLCSKIHKNSTLHHFLNKFLFSEGKKEFGFCARCRMWRWRSSSPTCDPVRTTALRCDVGPAAPVDSCRARRGMSWKTVRERLNKQWKPARGETKVSTAATLGFFSFLNSAGVSPKETKGDSTKSWEESFKALNKCRRCGCLPD